MRRTETDSHVEKLRCVSVKHSHIYIIDEYLQVHRFQHPTSDSAAGGAARAHLCLMFYFQFQTAVDI